MSKLTDSQLIVLSAAAARDDGLASVPVKMARAAASKVGSSLVARKLMREVKAKPGMPVWREDADGRSISLMITAAGRKAIGVDETLAEEVTVARSPERSNPRREKHAQIETTAPNSVSAQSPRAGSKQALLIEMLSDKTGATLDALVEATGWLAHTTRAALTGLRKRGFSIERKREGEASVYRIDQKASAAAAA